MLSLPLLGHSNRVSLYFDFGCFQNNSKVIVEPVRFHVLFLPEPVAVMGLLGFSRDQILQDSGGIGTCHVYHNSTLLKGQSREIFCILFFFTNQLLLVPLEMS